MTGVQTMEVVHGLFNNMKAVMEGPYTFYSWPTVLC